ncbi:MAG: cell division protein FtsL [Gammaproteobacteria bacterium]
MRLSEIRQPRLWIVAVAVLVVFANALAVVYTSARNRTQFSELSQLRGEHDQLVIRRGQLELEEWTLAAHARVAQLAETEMAMQAPARVRIVRVP